MILRRRSNHQNIKENETVTRFKLKIGRSTKENPQLGEGPADKFSMMVLRDEEPY